MWISCRNGCQLCLFALFIAFMGSAKACCGQLVLPKCCSPRTYCSDDPAPECEVPECSNGKCAPDCGVCVEPGKCNFYETCIEEQYKCGADEYPIGFGKKYCEKFLEARDDFEPVCQAWIDGALQCLQEALIPAASDERAASTSCEELKDFAFDSHADCYVDNGFCECGTETEKFSGWRKAIKVIKDEITNSPGATVLQMIETGWKCLTGSISETIDLTIGSIEDFVDDVSERLEEALGTFLDVATEQVIIFMDDLNPPPLLLQAGETQVVTVHVAILSDGVDNLNAAEKQAILLADFEMITEFDIISAEAVPFVDSGNFRHTSVDGDIFLEGEFMSLGVNEETTFGSENCAPLGFHVALGGACQIGFSIDHDGFDTGDPPLVGDFFLPGAPYEGFAVAFDGQTFNNAGRDGYEQNVVTEQLDTSDELDFLLRVESTAAPGPFPDVQIFHEYSFKNLDQAFRTRVKITNGGNTTISDVRYARSFDPDQESGIGGEPETDQTILAQFPEQQFCLVEGRGLLTDVPVFFYSTDSRATCLFGVECCDIMDLYSDVDTIPFTALGETITDDLDLIIWFKLGDLGPGEQSEFEFFTSLTASFDLQCLLAGCHVQATCDASTVPVTCTCNEGLEGDGFTCIRPEDMGIAFESPSANFYVGVDPEGDMMRFDSTIKPANIDPSNPLECVWNVFGDPGDVDFSMVIDDSSRDLLTTGPDEYKLACECIDADTGLPHGQIIRTELTCNQPVQFTDVTSTPAPSGPFTRPPTESEAPTDVVTNAPTEGPVTNAPTDVPVTNAPTDGPVTDVPTDVPVTEEPTDRGRFTPCEDRFMEPGAWSISFPVDVITNTDAVTCCTECVKNRACFNYAFADRGGCLLLGRNVEPVPSRNAVRNSIPLSRRGGGPGRIPIVKETSSNESGGLSQPGTVEGQQNSGSVAGQQDSGSIHGQQNSGSVEGQQSSGPIEAGSAEDQQEGRVVGEQSESGSVLGGQQGSEFVDGETTVGQADDGHQPSTDSGGIRNSETANAS